MTTAEDRRYGAWRVVLRCTRAAVIALVAALAVLVHHETAPPMAHVPPSPVVEAGDVMGMDHGSVSAAPRHSDAHTRLSGTPVPVAAEDGGYCSGLAMQHCFAAGVDTVKPAPPTQAAVGHAPAAPSRAAAGRNVPATVSRAPPTDLSLLSRLLL
jgi:hypothetical protein